MHPPDSSRSSRTARGSCFFRMHREGTPSAGLSGAVASRQERQVRGYLGRESCTCHRRPTLSIFTATSLGVVILRYYTRQLRALSGQPSACRAVASDPTIPPLRITFAIEDPQSVGQVFTEPYAVFWPNPCTPLLKRAGLPRRAFA